MNPGAFAAAMNTSGSPGWKCRKSIQTAMSTASRSVCNCRRALVCNNPCRRGRHECRLCRGSSGSGCSARALQPSRAVRLQPIAAGAVRCHCAFQIGARVGSKFEGASLRSFSLGPSTVAGSALFQGFLHSVSSQFRSRRSPPPSRDRVVSRSTSCTRHVTGASNIKSSVPPRAGRGGGDRLRLRVRERQIRHHRSRRTRRARRKKTAASTLRNSWRPTASIRCICREKAITSFPTARAQKPYQLIHQAMAGLRFAASVRSSSRGGKSSSWSGRGATADDGPC